MELMAVSRKIEDKIALLEQGRESLKDKVTVLVNASANYDKQLAITLLKLENKAIPEWEGQDCSKLAKSNMKKIAEGMCWKYKLDADTADKQYRLTLTRLECIKQELNGFQSINKYSGDI